MQKTVWGAGLAVLLASLGTSIANVALPSIAVGLATPVAQVQWVVIIYLLAVTVGSVSAGQLGDARGHAFVLRTGVVLFIAASGMAAVAPSIWVLLAARALQGAAAAVMMTLPLALLRGQAGDRLGRIAGLIGTLSALGTAAGPSLGGLLIAGFGWRAPFFALAGLGLCALAMLGRARQEPNGKSGDLPGAVVLAMALTGYALALTLRGPWSLPLLGGTMGLFTLFWRVETRSLAPLIAPNMLQDQRLWRGLAISAAIAVVMMGTLIVGPFYLATALGLGPAAVGGIMSVGPVISALFGLPAGRLSDRIGAQVALRIGLGVMLIGALVLGFIPGLGGYLGGIVLLTQGYQLVQAANTTRLLTGAATDRRGVISGLITLSRNLGLITGAAALGALYLWIGDAELGLRACFAIAAGLMAAILVLG